jgi:hypothetical protein
MCWVIGQLPCKLRTGDRVQGSASRKSEKDVPCGTRPGTSLVQSCFLIEAQVQRLSYCYEYGGKGGVARIH